MEMVDTNILYLALGYFIADILHYIFVVPYVLGLQKKLKDLGATTNKRH